MGETPGDTDFTLASRHIEGDTQNTETLAIEVRGSDIDAYGKLLAVTGGRQRLRTYPTSRGYDADAATRLAEDLHRAKTGRFREMVLAGRIPLRPGVRRLVDELGKAGVRLFVATTGSRDWVEPLLEHHFGPQRST